MKKNGIALALLAIICILTNPKLEQHVATIRERARSGVEKEGGLKAMFGKLLLQDAVIEKLVEYKDFKVFSYTLSSDDEKRLLTIGFMGFVF